MSLKVGSLVFSTDQGLGVLARSFFRAGVVTDVAVIAHGRRPDHPEWYPGALYVLDLRAERERLRQFCRSMDVMLFFETPFDWDLIPYCQGAGVKTVLMPMYECMPSELPFTPDEFICPSKLDFDYYGGPRSYHIPVPVDDEVRARWKSRGRVETFVHNAGHGGLKGRNGTHELVSAIRLVRSDARFIIRSQDPNLINLHWLAGCKDRVQVVQGDTPPEKLYAEGEAFLFPEKFNGLSLPLQEAYASGMLVMSSDRYPMNTWLPADPLLWVSRYQPGKVSLRCNPIDVAVIEPTDIAAKIDEWYGRDASDYSLRGKRWAESMSWGALKPLYMSVLHR